MNGPSQCQQCGARRGQVATPSVFVVERLQHTMPSECWGQEDWFIEKSYLFSIPFGARCREDLGRPGCQCLRLMTRIGRHAPQLGRREVSNRHLDKNKHFIFSIIHEVMRLARLGYMYDLPNTNHPSCLSTTFPASVPAKPNAAPALILTIDVFHSPCSF